MESLYLLKGLLQVLTTSNLLSGRDLTKLHIATATLNVIIDGIRDRREVVVVPLGKIMEGHQVNLDKALAEFKEKTGKTPEEFLNE